MSLTLPEKPDVTWFEENMFKKEYFELIRSNRRFYGIPDVLRKRFRRLRVNQDKLQKTNQKLVPEMVKKVHIFTNKSFLEVLSNCKLVKRMKIVNDILKLIMDFSGKLINVFTIVLPVLFVSNILDYSFLS